MLISTQQNLKTRRDGRNSSTKLVMSTIITHVFIISMREAEVQFVRMSVIRHKLSHICMPAILIFCDRFLTYKKKNFNAQ